MRQYHITRVSKRKITGAERHKINATPCPRYESCFVCSRSSFLLLPTNIAAENEGIGHSIPSVVWYCCYIDNSHRGTAEPSSVHGGSGDCERTYIFQCLCGIKPQSSISRSHLLPNHLHRAVMLCPRRLVRRRICKKALHVWCIVYISEGLSSLAEEDELHTAPHKNKPCASHSTSPISYAAYQRGMLGTDLPMGAITHTKRRRRTTTGTPRFLKSLKSMVASLRRRRGKRQGGIIIEPCSWPRSGIFDHFLEHNWGK
jgi:hypothetical protein